MIRYILLFLFSLDAFAAVYLVPCNHDKSKVCRIKSNQAKRNTLCKVSGKNDESKGSVYDVLISTPPDDSFTGTIAEWLGLNSRPWTPSEVLAEGERIVCRVNESKLQAIRDARQAAEKAEKDAKAAEVDRLSKLDQAKRQYCQKASKNNLEKILCAEWKREAVDDQ